MAGKNVSAPNQGGKHQKAEPKGDPDKTQRLPGLARALDVNDAYTDGLPSTGRHHQKDGA